MLMDKVINLLKSEREQTTRLIEFFKKEIEYGNEANKALISPGFIEKHKDSCNWTESWTIEQYIRANVNSNNRAIAKYTEKLDDANDYLLQIERALAVLNEGARRDE